MKIAILMLTHNAPLYVARSVIGIKKTKKVDYELIVFDNGSRWITRSLLKVLLFFKLIDHLVLNEENLLFAKGNNMASRNARQSTTHYLLLNSDIRIKDPMWLDKLISVYPAEGGICAFGAVLSEPIRADGYCLLIDKHIYDRHLLDEDFEWWWSITKLESQVLEDGYKVLAVKKHEEYLHHYGGASGKGYINAKGMDIEIEEVRKWFAKRRSEVIILEKI